MSGMLALGQLLSIYFAVPGGMFVAVGLLLAFVALIVWEIRRGVRGVSLLLRVMTALLAWAISTQPRDRAVEVETSDGRIAVLIDASRSMGVDDGGVRSARVDDLVSRWRQDSEGVDLLRFGSDLRAGSWTEPSPAVDDQSRLQAALSQLAEDESLGAIVVVSDGAVPEMSPRPGGPRVHAVLVGDGDIRDDSVASLEADPIGFLRQPSEVRVVVRSLGGGGTIPVTLKQGAQVVREVVVDVPEGGESEVVIPFTPRRLGRSVYRVSIPVEPGDAVPANNERAFLVRVTRDKLRVLLVAGQPTWDVRFLRAFLERDPSIDLISFFILRTTADMTMASPDEMALIPFPTDELFREHLGTFDVLFFQNFDFGPYQMTGYLPRIRDYVRRGGAFAMIGGDRSFSSGGYAGTPIAEILPVDLVAGDPEDERLLDLGRFAPRRPPRMARHPLVAWAPDRAASDAVWESLAPLHGTNLVGAPREGASVLLQHPSRRVAGRPMPVLVTSEAQGGRVMALTADTSWRWGMTTGGLTGDASAHERFWDRSLRWLSRDPALDPARITTDRERYGPNARVRIRGTLRDASYEPFDEDATLGIEDANGREIASRVVSVGHDGAVETRLAGPGEAGAFVAFAQVGEERVAEEGFVVETGGEELADPRPNSDVLRRIAASTEASFYESPESAPALDEFDATRTRVLGNTERAPFANPYAVLLCMALMSVEWWRRRRAGEL